MHLPLDAARKVEEQVLPKASRQTLAQFAASVRRAVLAADPRTAEDQHRDAVAERRVIFTPRDDGTTELWACGYRPTRRPRCRPASRPWPSRGRASTPAPPISAAPTPCSPSAPRSGRASSKPAVNVTVALSTLLAMDEQPGELAGHGPIPAALARAIAADPSGTWRRLVTDEHGNLADVSSPPTGHPPDGPLRRSPRRHLLPPDLPAGRGQLRPRPHDRLGARRHDCPANLMPLCSRHHHLKHDAGWRLHRLENDTVRWTTPTGHTYDRPPPDSLPIDTTTAQEHSATVPPTRRSTATCHRRSRPAVRYSAPPPRLGPRGRDLGGRFEQVRRAAGRRRRRTGPPTAGARRAAARSASPQPLDGGQHDLEERRPSGAASRVGRCAAAPGPSNASASAPYQPVTSAAAAVERRRRSGQARVVVAAATGSPSRRSRDRHAGEAQPGRAVGQRGDALERHVLGALLGEVLAQRVVEPVAGRGRRRCRWPPARRRAGRSGCRPTSCR